MMTFLNAGRMGRLCNMLFSVAGTIGIATKSNQNFGFPKLINWDAKEKFGSTEDIEVWRQFVNPLPDVVDVPFEEYPYFWGYRDIRIGQGNWNMNSHFQSEKYFSHCIDLIRHYFTMYEELTYNATALHIRRGDYDNNYHPHCMSGYYWEALQHVPRGTDVFVFSDDNEAAKQVMSEVGIHYVLIQSDYLESWKIMKRCKHFVIANSSYSLLAAILADQPGKTIVAPKKWFGDHVGLETVDLYPENSIVI
jgi:hypothetical protein